MTYMSINVSDHGYITESYVGLLNTYLPLAVIVFVINVKWFTADACRKKNTAVQCDFT